MNDMIELDDTPEIDPTTEGALLAIYERDGKLTADAVVAEAVDPSHPLHGRFQWDDTTAAHMYRLEQARLLIRSVEIVIEDTPIRAFPYVPSAGSYTPVRDALSNVDWRTELTAKFQRDAELFAQRWKNHKHLADTYAAWIKAQAAEVRKKK